MAGVQVENVVKRYGALDVLRDVSVDIPDGAFAVLVGPSGCGKSTLLRMIAGLEAISGGTIRIGNRVVNDLRPKERDIAMVFQSYALYPHMTVADNMSFSLRLKRLARSEIGSKVTGAARMLGLDALLSRFPRELSGGQRQRVAMGRSLVRSPRVFLFDEPLSNLDAKLRVQMRAEIKELHQRIRTTTVYVTHDQVEAMTMADVIVVMNAGEISQIGAPLELYDRPQNIFVAGFIGSPAMNLLPGHMTDAGFLPDGGVVLPSPAAESAVTYGIRPEHLHRDPEGLEAQVVVVEPLGSETQLVVRLGGAALVCLLRERIACRPGDSLRLRPDLEKIHLFDASGQRCNEG